jgi:hypothetical protein
VQRNYHKWAVLVHKNWRSSIATSLKVCPNSKQYSIKKATTCGHVFVCSPLIVTRRHTVEGQYSLSGPVNVTLGTVRDGSLDSTVGMAGMLAGGLGGAAVTVACELWSAALA